MEREPLCIVLWENAYTAGCEMMILIAIFAMIVSIWIMLIFILIKVYEIDAEIRSNRIMERWRDELE